MTDSNWGDLLNQRTRIAQLIKNQEIRETMLQQLQQEIDHIEVQRF